MSGLSLPRCIVVLADACRVKVEEPTVASDHLRLQEAYESLKDAERKVERLYARWAELEAKRQAYAE